MNNKCLGQCYLASLLSRQNEMENVSQRRAANLTPEELLLLCDLLSEVDQAKEAERTKRRDALRIPREQLASMSSEELRRRRELAQEAIAKHMELEQFHLRAILRLESEGKRKSKKNKKEIADRGALVLFYHRVALRAEANLDDVLYVLNEPSVY